MMKSKEQRNEEKNSLQRKYLQIIKQTDVKSGTDKNYDDVIMFADKIDWSKVEDEEALKKIAELYRMRDFQYTSEIEILKRLWEIGNHDSSIADRIFELGFGKYRDYKIAEQYVEYLSNPDKGREQIEAYRSKTLFKGSKKVKDNTNNKTNQAIEEKKKGMRLADRYKNINDISTSQKPKTISAPFQPRSISTKDYESLVEIVGDFFTISEYDFLNDEGGHCLLYISELNSSIWIRFVAIDSGWGNIIETCKEMINKGKHIVINTLREMFSMRPCQGEKNIWDKHWQDMVFEVRRFGNSEDKSYTLDFYLSNVAYGSFARDLSNIKNDLCNKFPDKRILFENEGIYSYIECYRDYLH